MIGRILWLLIAAAALAAAGLGYQVWVGKIDIPPRWNPFARFDVNEPPGPLTSIKFWRTVQDPARCAASLAGSGANYRPVADFSAPGGCGTHDAVRIMRSDDVQYNHDFIASCPLALAWVRFERQTVQPAALAVFGQHVKEIDHVGSYACRGVRTERRAGEREGNTVDGSGARPSPHLSQHATANAIDLTGFVLENGKRITVESDWESEAGVGGGVGESSGVGSNGGSTEASTSAATQARLASRFLLLVHDGACRTFNTTLGPDYNALHKTHFHVDMGPYRVCG